MILTADEARRLSVYSTDDTIADIMDRIQERARRGFSFLFLYPTLLNDELKVYLEELGYEVEITDKYCKILWILK